jgi:L-histidine Nalpha-methyltransferase
MKILLGKKIQPRGTRGTFETHFKTGMDGMRRIDSATGIAGRLPATCRLVSPMRLSLLIDGLCLMGTTSDDRLVIHKPAAGSDRDDFARDVRIGLTSSPKTLPPKHFYDELGSHLFEAICYLPEYYLTRAETEILSSHADEIVGRVVERVEHIRLIELGSGASEKSRFFIEAIQRRQPDLHYLPIELSTATLARSSEILLQDYPQLRITGYSTDYLNGLQWIYDQSAAHHKTTLRNMVLFLGSSIGNLDRDESSTLLRQIRKLLHPGDAFLLGADLKKPASVLVPAYDDALGVTAAFNLNLLVRINRELDGNFDITTFEHRAIYDEERGRVEMHLISREPQTARVRKIDLEISFEEGESIHTENSYKYDIAQLSELAQDTGFSLEETWYDPNHLFSLNLFVASLA